MSLLQRPGAGISYQRRGHGPAVLLIQGVGVVGEGWRPQVQELSDCYDLVSFDNRGIGASEMQDPVLSIETMAADALAIMDAERVERFHVVGHSMGGLIAQELALTHPSRVKSLALLCTFHHGREGARMTPDILVAGLKTRIGTRRMRRLAFLDLVMPGAASQDGDRDRLARSLEPLFGRDLADQPPIVIRQLRAMGRYDAGPRLAALGGIRTLVVSAVFDRIALPVFGRALAAAIPNARVVEIPDAGHGVTIQRSGRINALLAEHFGAT
jgi:3-oxoadipate enol-lactonase